ncbi:MAG: TonB-dependent receptor [Gemmatimonadaceae bacterium]|nr:TonB-dependent receptor [Gemmatimonadaceae bacterium]
MRWICKGSLLVFTLAGALAGTLPAQAPQGRITGLVSSSESGRPIEGARLLVDGTRLGAATRADGRYVITGVPAGTYQVRASMLGFAPAIASVTVPAGGSVTADFGLATRALAMEQIVVTGYGTTSRRELTGAIASVSGEDLTLKAAPAAALSNALQGRAAGVQVTTNSGVPGAGASVRVRGTNSITANSEPLYVIDGIPAAQGSRSSDPTFNPLNSIDPTDIESIDVLKDASATAIYGARGANGVVMVTTKHGPRSGNQTSIESSYGVQSISKRLGALNGPQYMQLRNEAYVNAGRPAPYTDAQIASASSYDYPSMMIQSAPQQSHAASFSGGDERTRFLISGNVATQKGVVVNSDFQRYGARLNLDREMTKAFRLGANVSMTRTQQGLNRTENGGIGAGANGVLAAMNFDPTIAPRNDAGAWNLKATLGEQLDNPLANALEIQNPRRVSRLLGSAFGELAPTENLRFRSTLGTNFVAERTPEFRPSTSPAGAQFQGFASMYSSQGVELTNENTVDYRRDVFGSSLDMLGGFSIQRSNFEDQYSEATTFPNDAFSFNNLGAGKTRTGLSTNAVDWTILSYFGRGTYNVRDKYLFTVTGRVDGSSRFAINNKWAFFPSAAFAWRAIDEPFMRGRTAFSDLKFRLSYGATGNQAINEYQSLSRLSTVFVPVGRGNEAVTLAPSGGAANPNLKWETQNQANVGVDAGFLNNRLLVTIDAYQSRTHDLLLDVPLPRSSGFSSQLQNVGSVRNRGVELSVTTLNAESPRFSWRSTLNVSANRNRVEDLGSRDFIDPGTSRYGFFIGNMSSHIVQVGEPIGSFYGFLVSGIFQQGDVCQVALPRPGIDCVPGEYNVLNTNGDSVINQSDRVILGSAQPNFYGGFSNSVTAGAWSFDAFINFSQGNKAANIGRTWTELATGFLNESDRVLNRWTPTNTSATIPRANNARPRWLYSPMVEDASFVRLQNVTVGYRLPSVGILPVQSARLFLTGQNLFVITRYTGFDPEVNGIGGDPRLPGVDVGAYPRARTWNTGLAVTF